MGRIGIINTARLSPQTFDDYTAVTLTQPVTNQADDTTTAVGADQLTWDYEFMDPELPSVHIFMGTIASLIQLAEHRSHTFPYFVGSWPDTDIDLVQMWKSSTTPSTMSKSILVKSIVAGVNHAIADTNYHPLKITVKNRGQIIADGAYVSFTLQPPASGADVAQL